MAQRRMFSLAVTDTDNFQDMPTSTQALYFHLGMHGDDDGFVGSPKKIARAAGCNADDIKLLISKGFIIPFESGVVVIRDWRVNNTLKNDRYHETLYQNEKARLTVNKSGVYELGEAVEPACFQIGTNAEPQHNVTERNLTKQNKKEADKPPRVPRSMPRPSVDEIRAFCEEKGYHVDAQAFFAYYESNGWRVGKNPMKSWQSALVTWERRGGEKHGNDRNASTDAAGDRGETPQFNVRGRQLD
ncbi:MAG: hypothetical protein E7422_04620 [Ruminococcaceae bacterium]|nr:hypothetical protein [Oscillospiraceae bacterium]